MQVDFYNLADLPVDRVLPRICERLLEQGQRLLVVADTEAHAAFFRRAFGLAEERVAVALVGADEPLFRPGWHPPEPFHVLFVAKLIPLHGLETILAAAAQVPEVRFRVVGDGQLAGLLDRRPANVEHVPWIPYEELPDAYRAAGCALGIFGTGDKAARVIPNKVFQALACARPVVTNSNRFGFALRLATKSRKKQTAFSSMPLLPKRRRPSPRLPLSRSPRC